MSLPSGYTRLEYIESTGTQYVNTGVLVSKNLEIKLKFMLTSITNHGIVGYMQSASSGTNRFAVFQYGGAWYLDFGNDTTGRISGGSFSSNTLYDITVGNRYIKNNETESNIISGSVISNVTNSNSISILCETDCGIGKIYSCQIYDNGTLVRDFIPCQKPDGAIGLWDDVNSVFYGNAGAGSFIAGEMPKGTHKTLINGTAYTVKGGKCLVNGTSYSIKKGRTLIGGTGYDINFEPDVSKTWTFDTSKAPTSMFPNLSPGSYQQFLVPFTSNGERFIGFGFKKYYTGIDLYYRTPSGGITACEVPGFWNTAYTTVTFDEAPSGDLLTWLEANATPQ